MTVPVQDSALPQADDLADLTELVEAQSPTTVYVRVSNGPDADAGERSRDYESGLDLPGLSVSVGTPPQWWTRPAQDWLARQLCSYAHLHRDTPDRIVWLCTGTEVGFGPDHEPLLRQVRPLVAVSPTCLEQAEARYRSRFDAGRDSRG